MPSEHTAGRRRSGCRFCARHAVEQRLDLVGGRFLDEECQDDTDRLLGDIAVDAEFGDKSPDKFVHVFDRPSRTDGGSAVIDHENGTKGKYIH